MPNFVTKSIQLYYKPHDGLSLNQGNADEFPTSDGPLIYYYRLESSVNPNLVDCNTTYTTVIGLSTTGGIELEAASFSGGPGCANPLWDLNQLAEAGVFLYYNNACTQEAAPGKYSDNPFPALTFDPADNEIAVVYSYNPPPSVSLHNTNYNWETYTIFTPLGGIENDLQSRNVSPINAVYVNFTGIPGQVYQKIVPVNGIPCNFSIGTIPLSNISYFPTEDVPPGATLAEIAEGGIPLMDGDGNQLTTGYFADQSFPSTNNDVFIYEAQGLQNSFTMNWEEFICTQVVAPNLPVKEFFVKHASTIEANIEVDSNSNSFCSIGEEIRIFYTSNSDYDTFEELMRAQEPIYYSNVDLPIEVLPEYWQLIHAGQGAYGLDDNRYFIYLLEEPPTTTGYTISGWYSFGSSQTYSLVDQNSVAIYCNVDGISISQVKTIDLIYSNTEAGYCSITVNNQAQNTITCQYLNILWDSSQGGNPPDLTLNEIISNQIPIYINSQSNPAYYDIPSLLLDSGFYGDQTGICYNFSSALAQQSNNPWRGRDLITISSEYSLPFICEGNLQQISLYSITGSTGVWGTLYPDYDFSDEWCYRQKTPVTSNYYYSLHPDLNFDIHQIVQYGVNLYTDLQLTNALDTDSYSDDLSYYYKWVNNVDGTGGNWIGLNAQGQETSSFIESEIQCNLTPNDNLFPSDSGFQINNTTNIGDDGELLAYYVFTSCIPINGVYSNYIVAGAHTNISDTQSGHMWDLKEEIGFNSTFFSLDSLDLKFGCKKLIGIIYAMDPSLAMLSMNELGYSIGNTEYVSAGTIGILSEGVIYYFNSEPYCQNCIDFSNASGSFTFPEFNDGTEIEDVSPRFDLEKNYNLHNVSKPLLRTNPRLTGNVKLVTSSNDEIYLESINANKELADSRYKRYGISKSGLYVYDVSRFFNDNKTPYDMVYETKRISSDFSVLETYDLQFEDEYQYGVRFNKSKLYDENFRIFAPIKLDTNIPKKFVIYRVNSPKQTQELSDSALDKQTRINELLANATIIKVFDLSETSNLGSYIRNHVFNEEFKSSPLTVSFEKNEQTFYNGIDLVKGGFTSKGEYIYKDFVNTDKPLIEANDFITDGFKRNRVVSADILNLEFMFDDNDAEDYSVNRYFGLYVDEIPTGRGVIQRVNNGLIKFKNLTSYMFYDNLEGSLFDGSKFAIPSSQMMRDIPILGYVKCDSHYHNILNGAGWDANNYTLKIQDNGDSINRFVGIKDTNRVVSLLENSGVGYDFVKIQITDIPSNGCRIAVPEIKQQSYCVEFINYISNTNITVNVSYPSSQQYVINTGTSVEEALNNIKTSIEADNYFTIDIENNVLFIKEKYRSFSDHGLNITSNNPACVLKTFENYTHFNLLENILTADDSIPKGRFDGSRFSNLGTTNDVLIALSSAIKDKNGLDTINFKDSIYVYANQNIGYDTRRFCVLLKNDNPNQFCNISNLDESNKLDVHEDILLNWSAYYMIGGHSDGRSVLISKDSVGGINIGDYINTKSLSIYNQVIDIVENINDLKGDYLKVVFKIRHVLGSGEFKVFSEYEAEIGLLSAYDMYDLGFDFYDTSNSDLKELKYETYENTNYVPANEAIFESNTDQESIANALEGIIDYSYYLTPDNFFANLTPVLKPESPTEESTEKIYSEFDRLKENQLKEFSTNSRIVPNINKWVLKDTKTVRDQPYYLNVNEAFGRTNFAPDITIEGRNASSFSHEWFYILNKPSYLKHYMLNDTFSYINYINGFNLTKDLFKSIDNDYFNNFMVSEGFDVSVDPDDSQIYVVTKSGDNLLINDEISVSLKFVVGETYLFNLSSLENPTLFSIETNGVGEYVYEIIAGTPYGKYTTLTSGYISYSYDSVPKGFISVNTEDLNKFEAFIKTNRNIKYTFSRGGSEIDFSSTIFKGLKFTFKNRKEFTKEIPSEFLKDSSFNEYKFSVVVDFKTGQPNNSINYEIIKNDKFNYVIFFINVNLDEVYVGNTLNRKLAYLLSNQLQSVGDEYINDDVKINGALDISTIDFNQPGPYIISGIDHFDGTSPDFLTQIAPGPDGTYGQLEIDYQIDDSNGDPIIYYLQIISVLSDSQIVVEGFPTDGQGNVINPVYVPLSLQEIAEYVYVGGGANNHNQLLSNLSINNIVDMINGYNPLIKYTTITKDGQELTNRFVMTIDDGKEIVRNSKLVATADINRPKSYSLSKGNIGYVLEESNNYYPFLIRHSGHYDYDLKPIVTFTDMYTHFKVNRNYVKNAFLEEKLFKNKFYKHPYFYVNEETSPNSDGPRDVHRAESYYRKYNRTNVAFNLGFISDDGMHDSNWGIIKNHFYHKVNEDNSTGVTKLSESSEFLPQYPLIGEIAIDKKDVNVFRSSWEQDYYRTALAGGEFNSAPGTLSTVESRSYLASTVMKLKESYTITSFTFSNVGTFENLDRILKNNSHTTNVVFAEDSEKVYIDFYMTDLISDVLSDIGVANEIKKYVSEDASFQNKTDLSDDVKSYVNNNLVSLFSIDEVELYVRKTQSEITQLNPVESLDQINNGGFEIDINYTLVQHKQRPVNFRLIYNKSLGYSYVMRPVVKIKQ